MRCPTIAPVAASSGAVGEPRSRSRMLCDLYIARSQGGTFKVLQNLGHINPHEPEVPIG